MDGLLWFLMGVGVLVVVGSIVLVRTLPRDAPAASDPSPGVVAAA